MHHRDPGRSPQAPLSALAEDLSYTWRADLRRALEAAIPGWSALSVHERRSRLHDLERDPEGTSARDLDRLRGAAADLAPRGNVAAFWVRHGAAASGPIAYFSAEFAVHESLPVYAGGLGVLAGDHLKSAADLGVPLVGVGLLYRDGYFRQGLEAGGRQVEGYTHRDPGVLPVARAVAPGGEPVTVVVPYAGRRVYVSVWCARVGSVPLLLLDSDRDDNRADDRALTARLYGGDSQTRIGQELLLGAAGLRALRVLGIAPSVLHMNEGHSAFLGVERLGEERRRGLAPAEARRAARASTVFTTHTPVAAGHDRFSADLVGSALGGWLDEVGLTVDELLALGRVVPGDRFEPLCMTVLALRLSGRCNGVSRLHGEVSRAMWAPLWPGLPEGAVPIGHVTNGVHAPTWLGSPLAAVLTGGRGPDALARACGSAAPLDLASVPDDAIWQAHQEQRRALAGEVVARGLPRGLNDPFAGPTLVIGFARRFATYKRADLLLRDPDAAADLLADPLRPIVLLFAGKAHPQDGPGKELLHRILLASEHPRLRGRVVFLPDYDLSLGRLLVQGCDLWLNNPQRPKEASGTSGQKAAMNGVPNLSVLDGWWAEGYRPGLGWAIPGATPEDGGDEADRRALLETLARDVLPAFHDRGGDGLPRRWIAVMRASMADALPRFNTDRMLGDYVRDWYAPAARGEAWPEPTTG